MAKKLNSLYTVRFVLYAEKVATFKPTFPHVLQKCTKLGGATLAYFITL